MPVLAGWQIPPFWQGQGLLQSVPSGQCTSQLQGEGVKGERDPHLGGCQGWGGWCRVGSPYSQGAGQPRGAEAGAGGGIAGRPVVAGAGQAAALAIGAGWARLVAQWVGKAGGAGADPAQRVAGGPMVAVAAVSTARPP